MIIIDSTHPYGKCDTCDPMSDEALAALESGDDSWLGKNGDCFVSGTHMGDD